MTVRVRLKGDKATIRFGNNMEERWFMSLMCSIRDSDPKTHPELSVRDKGGEIPKLPKPMSQKVEGKPINVPQKLTPEMIKKMEIQQPMKVQPLVKGKPIKEKKK